jgi:hypothetical protein
MEGTTEMLLSWFREDELSDCAQCGNKHLLPVFWAKEPGSPVCATCGTLPRPDSDASASVF